ncbi:MAG: hypothetical protein M3O15_09420 [Acidobacteriota bacterium]|nr:hypothetical protein [Acidobacteriota bacterium]
MPIKKFRSLQEMEDSLRREPGDPRLWRAIAGVWRFAARTCPRHFPPGVHRHRTVEDALRQRDIWEEADFRKLWDRRSAGSDAGRAPR